MPFKEGYLTKSLCVSVGYNDHRGISVSKWSLAMLCFSLSTF